MKNGLTVTITGVLALAAAALVALWDDPLHAQGSLEPPPGPPAPSMKSLQEIWDKIDALETRVGQLQQQLSAATAQPGFGFPIEMMTVGNAGNFPDPGNESEQNVYGAVGYEYRIGKYEVTNAQYVQFLNAVAATDTNNLYDTGMASDDARGGIQRVGASGSQTYRVKANMGDKPVNFVSWYDAVRFCNWLHNGRPRGAQDATTTEGGAYTLTGPTTITLPGTDPVHGASGRNAGARCHLPSEDEWYKAAYHIPNQGDTFFRYPTQSNDTPTIATADPFGNIDNDDGNIANYGLGADWNGQNGNLTTVGSGGPGSASFFGAFDMGGNVWEWNEQIIGTGRGLRGGSWLFGSDRLRSSDRISEDPADEDFGSGFRVAGP